MKKNSYFVKSIIGLSLIGTVLLANDIEIDDDKKELDIKSSIQIKGDISELEEKISAKIDASDVIKIIKKEQNGKIINIDLENEDGNLVYKAEVLNDKVLTDFIVDAGNGQILNKQIDKSDEKHDRDEEENDDEKDKK
jgi:uncharacterized membrane protein YkoI